MMNIKSPLTIYCYTPSMKNLNKQTRREFISSSVLAGTALMLLPQGTKAEVNIKFFKVIEHVQEVLFPKHSLAPAASEFAATNYLARVSLHSSFLPGDLLFLNNGANSLLKSEPKFLSMNLIEQEKAVKRFSKTSFGEGWLSFVLFYTLEALLSDPIYGGNKQELGWKWLGHNTGQPRPKTIFGASNEKI